MSEKIILTIKYLIVNLVISLITSANLCADQEKESMFSVKINPQFLNYYEDLGIYFGFNDNEVKDKFEYDKVTKSFVADFSVSYGDWVHLAFNYTDSKDWGFGETNQDYLAKYWYNASIKCYQSENFDLYAYYSSFDKELFIEDEVDYLLTKNKYLLGIGVGTSKLRSFKKISFSTIDESGLYGIIYSGIGNFENKLSFTTTNPYNTNSSEVNYFKASNDLGYVFYMDMGGVYFNDKYYFGGKLEVGGFFNGIAEQNRNELEGEVITGTIIVKAIAGYRFTECWDITFDYTIKDENCRNEGDVKDGSHFTAYFLELNSKFYLNF